MNPPTPYYDHDGITIYCGDNRQVLPFLGKFDLLLTDPPYGIGFAAQPTTGGRRRGQPKESWDNAAPTALELLEFDAICDDSIIWGGNYFGLPPSKSWLVWTKPDAPPSMGKAELAWTNLGLNTQHFIRSIAATNPERIGHPTQKPLDVISWCLSHVPEAKSVLDPWMGSGTTLVAAKLRGLRAVGIEINEDYCKIAVERLRQGVLLTV